MRIIFFILHWRHQFCCLRNHWNRTRNKTNLLKWSYGNVHCSRDILFARKSGLWGFACLEYPIITRYSLHRKTLFSLCSFFHWKVCKFVGNFVENIQEAATKIELKLFHVEFYWRSFNKCSIILWKYLF